jgi:DNA-binding LytR/AlgR family response regulator
MGKLFRAVLAVFATLAACAPGLAQDSSAAEPSGIAVCPAEPGAPMPSDWTGPGCETVAFNDLDPQGRMIWVRMRQTVDPARLADPAPLGVLVSAKSTSEVWLNGLLIGRNGVPAASRRDEVPGRMDAAFAVPPGVLQADNEIVLRMSSHRGLLRLSRPAHWVMVGPLDAPQDSLLRHYWPSLIPFGALLAGGLYWAAAAATGEQRRASVRLAAMSLCAAGQLFAEVTRGLYAYPYPFHDLRLILVLLFALGFGLALAAHVVFTFEEKRPRGVLSVIAGITLLVVLGAPGFDQKSGLAVLLPTLGCALMAALWTFERKPDSVWHLVALAAFAGTIVAAPYTFLDVLVFYVVAAFLLFLFVRQAVVLAEARREQRREAERAGRLELALERTRAAEPARAIKVASAGRIELAPLGQIVCFKGAGDYVEIRLVGGRELLHSESLNELETRLPATFVRVHRSYIVNTAYVRALAREASGVGRLILSEGPEIPVSRRVLPKVRVALDEPIPSD